MIEKVCHDYGLYLVLLVGVLAIQAVFSLGHLETREELGWIPRQEKPEEQVNLFEKMALSSSTTSMPLAFFVAAAGIIVMFGMGLVADVILLMKWLAARSQRKGLVTGPPAKTLPVGPWEAADLFKLFVLLTFVISCLHAALYLAMSGRWISQRVLGYVSLVASTAGLYVVVLVTLFTWRRKRYPSVLSFPKPTWDKVKVGLTTGLWAYVSFIPPLIILMFVGLLVCEWLGIVPQAHEIVEVLRRERSLVRWMYLGIITALVGPVVEEIVFRGVAYSVMRKRLGIYGAAAGSSLIFALAHANAAATLPVFGMGVVLAMLYEFTGSLIASMTFHVVNNTLAFALTLFVLSWMK